MPENFDFIIVGGGTAGCAIARHLSDAQSKPSVLILEAGSSPIGEYLQAPVHRYAASALRQDLDYGYMSEDEPTLNGRKIHYTRGKGLGGSSILNFGVYLYGSKEDYDEWARLVGDPSWGWSHVKDILKEIETYDTSGALDPSYGELARPGLHGNNGLLKVGLPQVLEKGVRPQIEALIDMGETLNLDPNSGDPIGISVFPFSYSRAGRSTSATAHLLDARQNLILWTDARVTDLVWEGKRVVGVETSDGRKATSKNEIILAAGSIDTPRLLLLNGIGPQDELQALGIRVKTHLSGVGKHLQDHVYAFMSVEVDGKANDRTNFEKSPESICKAAASWNKDKSGDFATQQSCLWGGFLKLPELENFPEYNGLSKEQQDFLARPAVPAYEFINNSLKWPPTAALTEGNSYMTCLAILMNPQSEGSVTLRTRNSDDNPIIRLNHLTQPYDKRVFREAIREVWKILVQNPTIAKDVRRTLCGPASLSDPDIDAFMAANANTVWHANGTAMMGKHDNPKACVSSNFKVLGVEGLRVADLSVCPLTPNNHTQSTAYLVGRKAANVLVEEYRL